ncbi:hypothetical protein RM543_08705 [Roseicyclus sp. F158]|uniref:Uncharacterized protein n=1 Tax=Tropicimonas omnivorans TaxID=3075590 RepID=A0ABU3DGB9_9RHOB|nr:hypothetical protein [Roseicyclus sp. F158]MDT0682765.1 hypothetical protein [Roseicyclus sp. F158]
MELEKKAGAGRAIDAAAERWGETEEDRAKGATAGLGSPGDPVPATDPDPQPTADPEPDENPVTDDRTAPPSNGNGPLSV